MLQSRFGVKEVAACSQIVTWSCVGHSEAMPWWRMGGCLGLLPCHRRFVLQFGVSCNVFPKVIPFVAFSYLKAEQHRTRKYHGKWHGMSCKSTSNAAIWGLDPFQNLFFLLPVSFLSKKRPLSLHFTFLKQEQTSTARVKMRHLRQNATSKCDIRPSSLISEGSL